jgi:hypothetical protein
MGKFISIPFQGGATTLPIPGTATVTNGVLTGVALGTAGAGLTTAPIIVVTSTDNLGSGAVVVPVMASNAIASYVVSNGGTGYTSASTMIFTVTWPPCIINADAVIGIDQDVAGSAASTSVVTVRLNSGSVSKVTLTFKTALSAAQSTDQRLNLINAIALATNVKIVEQITPVVLTNGAVLSTAVFAA